MFSQQSLLVFIAIACLSFTQGYGYSAWRDARVIAEHKRGLEINHAKVARQLVHNANWASVGTISADSKVKDFPMVNVISVDDSDAKGAATGKIHFLLTDLDFTGQDWQSNNKVTFLFSDEQTLNCQHAGKDPMEPTCARVMISGKVKKLDTSTKDYEAALKSFVKRHPASIHWIPVHDFYLNELDIEHIYMLDFYGGPHDVAPADYYAATL